MFGRTTRTAMAVALIASASQAQDQKRVEISGNAGWTHSDGVTGPAVRVTGLGTFTNIKPKSAFSGGGRLAFHIDAYSEVGFLFSQQASNLSLTGLAPRTKIGDMDIRNYHGYFAYNYGEPDEIARPYLLFGLGATDYAPKNVSAAGTTRAISAGTRFSGTAAIGVKVFPNNKNLGIRIESRWTPTYLRSSKAGWWCDPFFGCYTRSDAQFSNQVEWTIGFMARF